MILNIELHERTPEQIKSILEHHLPERPITIGKRYGDVSCDFEITPKHNGVAALVCTLEVFQEMTCDINPWEIRFW